MAIQLRLFHEPRSDLEELSDEFDQILKKVDNFRKSYFGKLSTLSCKVTTLQAEVDILQAQLYVQERCMKTLIDKMNDLESRLK